MAFNRALLVIGAAFVVGSVSGASAADLGNYGGGSIKDAPYQVAAPSAGWYFRIDGGYAAYDADSVSIVDQNTIGAPAATVFSNFGGDVGDGWSVGGGIGRYFGNGFRGDLTLEYRGSTDLRGSASADPCCELVETQTEFDGVVGLANLYYDFNRGGRFIPYIGAGIGFAHLKTDGGTLSCSVPNATYSCATDFGDAEYGSSSKTNFAVAAMAGVSIKLRGGEPAYVTSIKDAPVEVSGGRALYLDAGYRFLYLGDFETHNAYQSNTNQIDVEWNDLTAHEVRVGLRYELN